MNLKDKTILVTGASSGIGQGIAIASARKGAKVLISYRKNVKGAEETLAEVEKHSSGQIFQADLSVDQERTKMFEQIKESVGGIDILINSAGEYKGGDFFDNQIWKDQMENIFFTAVRTSQNFLKQNTDADLRKIINITSIWGQLYPGNERCMAYAAAKAALASVTVALAKFDPKVQVNAVAPGYTWSPPWQEVSEEYRDSRVAKTTINRFITPDEIALMVIALLENEAMNGQVVSVDGGFALRQDPSDKIAK